eukprot:1341321-Pyramimonas_sp.AAC.1
MTFCFLPFTSWYAPQCTVDLLRPFADCFGRDLSLHVLRVRGHARKPRLAKVHGRPKKTNSKTRARSANHAKVGSLRYDS